MKTVVAGACAFLAVAATSAGAAPAAPSWPTRVVLNQSFAVASEAIGGGYRYALSSLTVAPVRGPYVLERTDLRTGLVTKGPRFVSGSLALGAGRLWVSDASAAQGGVVEVDPQTLRRIRSIRFPMPSDGNDRVAVAAASPGSVWIGTSRTLLRVDAARGSVLARAEAPPGLAVDDLAVDPGGRHLYVSAARLVRGGVEGAALLEYDARTGRLLARSATRLLDDSVAGAALTAVPGGVWASFRTGMLGVTIHLRQRDLALVPPPGPNVALRPANGLFHWPMDATTVYGAGALWLANEAGLVACVDPTSGRVLASERFAPTRETDLLAVDDRWLFALVSGPRLDLVQITPPRACWS